MKSVASTASRTECAPKLSSGVTWTSATHDYNTAECAGNLGCQADPAHGAVQYGTHGTNNADTTPQGALKVRGVQ